MSMISYINQTERFEMNRRENFRKIPFAVTDFLTPHITSPNDYYHTPREILADITIQLISFYSIRLFFPKVELERTVSNWIEFFMESIVSKAIFFLSPRFSLLSLLSEIYCLRFVTKFVCSDSEPLYLSFSRVVCFQELCFLFDSKKWETLILFDPRKSVMNLQCWCFSVSSSFIPSWKLFSSWNFQKFVPLINEITS